MAETLLQKAQRLGIKPAGTPVASTTPTTTAPQGETLFQKAQRLGVKPAGTPVVQPQEKSLGLFGRIQKGVDESAERRAQSLRETSDLTTGGKQSFARGAFQTGGQLVGSAIDPVVETVKQATPEIVKKGVVKILSPLSKGISYASDKISDIPAVQKFAQTDQSQSLEKDIEAGNEYLNLLPAPKATKALTNVTTKVVDKATDVAKSAVPDVLKKDVATLRAEKVTEGYLEQNTRLKSVDNAYKKNTKTRTLENGEKVTVTPVDTLAKYNIAPEVEKGTIKMGDYQTNTGALGKIREEVTRISDEIDTKLVNSGKKVPLQEMKLKAEEIVKADPELRQSGKVQTTLDKLETRFKDYQASYGDDLDIAEINNIRKVANKDFSPDTMDVSRVIGDTSRDIVYNATDDKVVKQLLQEQGDLLSAKKYVETINGTKVTGGRLGTMAMRTLGGIVGSTLPNVPVVGGILGAIGGDFASRALQQTQFKSIGAEAKALLKRGGQDLRSNKIQQTIKPAITPTTDSIMPKTITPVKKKSTEVIPTNKIGTPDPFDEFPRDKSLKGSDAEIQEKSIKKYTENKEALLNEYMKTNGNIINTDEARKLFKDVGYKGSNARAVQEASSALAKDAWRSLLKSSKADDVFIYAGGSGTGKTSVVKKLIGEEISKAGAILDGNLSTLKSAVGRIEESINAGKTPKIVYVYRDAKDAWINGVIKRMKNNPDEGGRIVPLSVFLDNHAGSHNVIKELLKTGKYDVKLLDNSMGKGKEALLSKEKFDSINYDSSLRQELLDETKKLYEQGNINKTEYEELIQ